MNKEDVSDIASILRDLLQAIAQVEYLWASLTIDMFHEHWETSIDAGPKVDDVLQWRGECLAELLTRTLSAVAERRAPSSPGHLDERFTEDLPGFLALLLETRDAFSAFPLEIAFVPRSAVEPERPWEVAIESEGQTVITPGQTALEALLTALGR